MNICEELKEKYGVDLSEVMEEVKKRNEAWRDLAALLNHIGRAMVEYRLFSIVELPGGKRMKLLKEGRIVRLEIVTLSIIGEDKLSEAVHMRIDISAGSVPEILHVEGSPPSRYTLHEIVRAIAGVLRRRVEAWA